MGGINAVSEKIFAVGPMDAAKHEFESRGELSAGRQIAYANVVVNEGRTGEKVLARRLALGNPEQIHLPLDAAIRLYYGQKKARRVLAGSKEAEYVKEFLEINHQTALLRIFLDLIGDGSEKMVIEIPGENMPQVNILKTDDGAIYSTSVKEFRNRAPEIAERLFKGRELPDDGVIKILGHASDNWGINIADSGDPEENSRRIIFELLRYMGFDNNYVEMVDYMIREQPQGLSYEFHDLTKRNMDLQALRYLVDPKGKEYVHSHDRIRPANLLSELAKRHIAMAELNDTPAPEPPAGPGGAENGRVTDDNRIVIDEASCTYQKFVELRERFGTYNKVLDNVKIGRKDVRHDFALYNAIYERDGGRICNLVKEDLSAPLKLARAFNTITDYPFFFNNASLWSVNFSDFEWRMFFSNLDDERKTMFIATLNGTEAARKFARERAGHNPGVLLSPAPGVEEQNEAIPESKPAGKENPITPLAGTVPYTKQQIRPDGDSPLAPPDAVPAGGGAGDTTPAPEPPAGPGGAANNESLLRIILGVDYMQHECKNSFHILEGIFAAMREGSRDTAISRHIQETEQLKEQFLRIGEEVLSEQIGSLPLEEKQREWLEMIRSVKRGIDEQNNSLSSLSLEAAQKREISSLYQKISQVLGVFLSYIENGRFVLELQEIDLEDFLKVWSYIFSSRIQVKFSAEQGCPKINSDLRLLALVIDNIARNAQEALLSSAIADPQFSINIRKENDRVAIELSDNGPGIAKEDLPHLFDLFWTKGKTGGSGIGLALVKEIVSQLGGTIEVQSELGKGTTFTIRLPITPPSGTPASPAGGVPLEQMGNIPGGLPADALVAGDSPLAPPDAAPAAGGGAGLMQGAPGGIDFRNLPIVTQAISNLSVGISLTRVNSFNLDAEWQEIEKLLNSGITPSPERMKEYVQASSYKGAIGQDKRKIILCISDILRMEEESCFSTDPTLKDILVVLGSARSAGELKAAFSGIR